MIKLKFIGLSILVVTIVCQTACNLGIDIDECQNSPLSVDLEVVGSASVGYSVEAVLFAGTGAETYSWSTGANTNTITDVPAGTYSVDVTGSDGCVASASVTITPNPTVTDIDGNVYHRRAELVKTKPQGDPV